MRARRPLSARSKLLASAALVGLLLAAVAAVVQSAFTSTVRNPGNTFEAGTIELSGSIDRESALFDLRGLKPGPVASRCVRVAYASSGGLASTVRLYGATTGPLGEHLDVRIVRGTFSGAAPADGGCSGFTASSQTPLYAGTLAALPASYAAGIEDSDGAWTDGESAVYRIDVDLADSDDAQGDAATSELIFEARST